jgi:hemoglobin
MTSSEPSQAGERSLYERIGGAPGVAAVVHRFYDAVLEDADLAPYFDGVDMDRLRVHQQAFVGAALGGPQTYDGKLSRAHAGLGVTDMAFDRVVGHLLVALDEGGIGTDVAASIVERLAPLRGEIVHR